MSVIGDSDRSEAVVPTEVPVQPWAAEPEAEAAVPAPATSTQSSRRRWPWLVGVAVLAAAVGVGATIAVTHPTTTRLRSQRNAVQVSLDQTSDQLKSAKAEAVSANAEASTAKAAVLTCQALVTDSRAMVDQFDQMSSIVNDPANQTVDAGSARGQELIRQIDTIGAAIARLEGSIQSDAGACDNAPAAT